MVEAARPSCRAIARRLSPSAFNAASCSLSSRRRCVPPDIAPSRMLVPGQGVTITPRDVALHPGLRPGRAQEQDRPDIALARALWRARQRELSGRLIFIDETGADTKM